MSGGPDRGEEAWLSDGGAPLPDGRAPLPDGGAPLPDGGAPLPDADAGLASGGFRQRVRVVAPRMAAP
ncbi:MAG TPA: hypothetical protein VN601_03245, partial [Arthrobacter sp.]|nr:hypothetical protein [Arthrobacter sp.]